MNEYRVACFLWFMVYALEIIRSCLYCRKTLLVCSAAYARTLCYCHCSCYH